LNSSYDLIEGVEDQIQTFTNSVERKKEIHNELTEEFKKLRTEVERNIYIKYPLSLTQVKANRVKRKLRIH